MRNGFAGVAQLVERQPSKLNVAGSNPVSRSKGNETKQRIMMQDKTNRVGSADRPEQGKEAESTARNGLPSMSTERSR